MQQLPKQHLLIGKSKHVPFLSLARILRAWERQRDGLQMQYRIYRARWRAVRCVRDGNIQGGEWIGGVCGVRRGHILGGGGSSEHQHVRSVPHAIVVSAWKRQRHRLQVQCWVYGGRRGDMHGVRSWRI